MKNKSKKHFSLHERIKSFKYAINGLSIVFRKEHNARIHIAIAILSLISGLLFSISKFEWLVICLLIGLVISLEIINTAIEYLCDYVSPEWKKQIETVKDLAAAAVLVAATVALVCGILIFAPYIIKHLL